MKLIIPLMFCTLLLVGFASSCKHNPVEPPPKCDTCKTDTTCDTCKHDTIPKVSDTTSHNFNWTQSTIPSEAGLTGCWVFGPNSIYVVGGSVWKSTDGITWKNVSPHDSKGNSFAGGLSGYSMFGFSENDYWLTDGGLIIHVVNQIGTIYSFPKDSAGYLHSIWGTSSSDMYAVGDAGTILHFDGSIWTKMLSGTLKNLQTIWGTDDQHIWAAGWNISTGAAEEVAYDGTAWRVDQLSTSGEAFKWGLSNVWACDSANIPVAFVSGSQLFRKTGQAAWRDDDSDRIGNRGSDGSYIGVGIRGNAPNDLIVAGNWGFISHWNGASWHQFTGLYNYSDAEFGCSGLAMNGNTWCAIGFKDGSSWVATGQR
jgi:hypothetical protein